MKTKIIIVTFILIFVYACSTTQKKSSLSTSQPSAKDLYWNDIAMELNEAKSSILNVIQENNPNLYSQISKDAKDPYLTMFWGQSFNLDSGTKQVIVAERIIADLQLLFNIQNDNKIVHAGIMHTYGYLFSVTNTPYGYKRERWISPELSSAFSLSGNSLSSDTIEGGLLSNITFFAGSLAFKNKSDLKLLKNVSNEVFIYNYSNLKFEKLEEVLKDYTLVTTFVPYPHATEKSEYSFLLIYSIVNHFDNKETLITAFPTNKETYKKVTAPKTLGENQKITLRYNAYLSGLEKNLEGKRKLTKY